MFSVKLMRDGGVECSGARQAFSLVELAVVVAVIGVLACMALPRFANFLAHQRVEAAARRIVVDLGLAQRNAKSANADQTVRFDPAISEYWLVGMPHPDHPSLEYKVSLREEPYGAVLVSANFAGDPEITFDIYGVPDSGGSVVIRVGNHVRTITVDAETGKTSAQ